MDALFEGAGGFNRALAWIESSNETYGDFFKLWARGAVRATNLEVGVSEGVENLLDKLDQAERTQTIDVVPRVVEDDT